MLVLAKVDAVIIILLADPLPVILLLFYEKATISELFPELLLLLLTDLRVAQHHLDG